MTEQTDPTIERHDDVFVLDFGDSENMTTVAWTAGMHELLDQVDAAEGPKALVTTGSGKHYSNGLDVGYMSGLEAADTMAYVSGCIAVVHRIMLLGAPTVAAVNGHAFGMGAFLVAGHDHAVMREDRGYLCFPEIHLGMAFSDELLEIANSTLSPRTRRQALTTGHRYSGPEAVTAGMVDATSAQDAIVQKATEIAAGLSGTAGATLGTIKQQLFPTIAARVASNN